MSREFVDVSSQEFSDVSDYIKKTFRTTCIISIEKIYNPVLDMAYEERKADYKVRHGCDKEVRVFHGTKDASVDSIVRDGFDVKYSRIAAYGIGTYFATHFSTSTSYVNIDNEDHSFIFICKILPGRQGSAGSGQQIDRSKYDSSSGAGCIYSIPQNDAIKLEYLVRFYLNAK